MDTRFSFLSPTADATHAAGVALARAIGEAGLLIALDGDLGVGKTAFVKGIAAGLGIDPADVSSPTFVIAAEHLAPGGRRLVHLDLYRIASADELESAGFLDLLEATNLIAVEWASRVSEAMPADRLGIEIERTAGADERTIQAVATGPAAAATLVRWRATLEENAKCL